MSEDNEVVETIKLAKAQYNQFPMYPGPYVVQPTYMPFSNASTLFKYHEVIKQCRFFYEQDTIAGTVIDRIVDIASTPIRNKHRRYSQEIKNYYDGIATNLVPLLKIVALTYLIDGMSIAECRTASIMGNRLHQKLGRTRYEIPKAIWVRDNAYIKLKKSYNGERIVYQTIPDNDIRLIESKGIPGREQEYLDLVALYPEYVAKVAKGDRVIQLEDAHPVMRRLLPYNEYPIPYLNRSLEPLNFRRTLKRMDKITSDRVIAALRQISIGNDEYPADDDDITAAKNVIQSQTNTASQETIFNVYTNHTIKIQWVVPPIDNLLNKDKYIEANADVFIGMGFPRLWIAGENERSNSSDNGIAAAGPIKMIEGMRDDILEWVKYLYADLAEKNGFSQYPDPYYTPISLIEYSELLQYASSFVDNGTISRNTVAEMYNSTFDTEQDQIAYEETIKPKVNNDNDRTVPKEIETRPNIPSEERSE